MKKIFLSLLITIIIFPSSSLAFFNDIPSSHPDLKIIQSLEEQQVISNEESTFRPEEKITKGEYLKLILRNAGFKAETEEASPIKIKYQDLKESDPLTPYIKKALEINLLTYQPSQPFLNPNQGVSKINALKYLFFLEGIPTPKIFNAENIPFEDVASTSWFSAYVNKAVQLKIVNTNELYFRAFENINRIEAAKLIYNLRQNSNTNNTPSTTSPPKQENPPISKKPEIEVQKSYILPKEASTIPNIDVFVSVWEKINQSYLNQEDLNQEDLSYEAIKGMVESLEDPYSVFSKPQTQAVHVKLGGEVEGIGAQITLNDEGDVIIISPFKNSPAQKAGLLPEDIIKRINGQITRGLTIEEIATMIRGPENTIVDLTIYRKSINKTFEIEITRGRVLVSAIYGEIKNEIGVITITLFNENADQEFDRILNEILVYNPKGLIIDVRNNPGGYLDVCLKMLERFVPKEEILTKVAYSNATEIIKSNGPGDLNSYPIVVLINKGSASASEILAGTLQDHNLATIIGENSFGKGSVQELISYRDGSALKITVARWLTPNGKSISKQGITPDIIIKNDPSQNTDPQFEKAMEVLNR